MARRCSVTGKGVQTGHNVSHANNKTKRRFLPNLQYVGVLSETLASRIRLRISTSAIRSIEHAGGFDNFVLSANNATLSPAVRRIKRRIEQAASRKAKES